MRRSIFRVLGSTLALSCFASAEVTLPAVLSDHMVIQRCLPVHLWGKAGPGESVSVEFRGESGTAKADSSGRWSVYLKPGEAGGPFAIAIRGTNAITLNDVLVGDVWLASGQSNMQFDLAQTDNGPMEVAAARYPRIRRLQIARRVAEYPMENAEAQPWIDIRPENAGGASAVAYFFARHLQEKLGGVPIGIIESYWGGTPVEAWMSLRSIGEDARLMPIIGDWARSLEAWPRAQAGYERRMATWTAAAAQARTDRTPVPPRPSRPASGPGGSSSPAGLYNAMIAPLTPFPIRGAIWYQGESNAFGNASGASLYARAFQAMIRDWRRAWGLGDFPFLFVQLANFKANPFWPEVREAQRESLSVANTAMAVAIDIGDPADIHPKNKQDVGLRLGLAARAIAYGEKIEYAGPMFRQITAEPGGLRVWFDHVGKGLAAKGGALKGFEIAGPDGNFFAAEARIEGATVALTNASIAAPVQARYGWADNPDCNLFNADGLPASPFRFAR